jgi:hypothetical protein
MFAIDEWYAFGMVRPLVRWYLYSRNKMSGCMRAFRVAAI